MTIFSTTTTTTTSTAATVPAAVTAGRMTVTGREASIQTLAALDIRTTVQGEGVLS